MDLPDTMRDTRNPHQMRRLLVGALAEHGSDVSSDEAGSLLARLLQQPSWPRLLDVWDTGCRPMDDMHLGTGEVLARRSRQLDVLRAGGLSLGAAVDVVYSIHPTSAMAPVGIDAEKLAVDGYAVRDGMYVRLTACGKLWGVEAGLGRTDPDGRLLVQFVSERGECGAERHVAAERAAGILRSRVSDLKNRFIERRSYFRFTAGELFETVSGSMDTFEVISPGVGRAFMSGSGEPGCYVLGPSAAEMLPAFAIYERGEDGRAYLDAEGMGLIVPMIFPDIFTQDERDRAGRMLAEDHPLTFAVLAGGMLDKSNFDALVMEWDDEHEPEDLPEYMLVRPLDGLGKGGHIVVLGVRTDDILARRDIAEGHLFVMPSADYAADSPIDPDRHRKIESRSMTVALVRPR